MRNWPPAGSLRSRNKGGRHVVLTVSALTRYLRVAKRWLDEHGVAYTARHIKEENPTCEELKTWHARSGLPLKRFFNTSGLAYKALGSRISCPP